MVTSGWHKASLIEARHRLKQMNTVLHRSMRLRDMAAPAFYGCWWMPGLKSTPWTAMAIPLCTGLPAMDRMLAFVDYLLPGPTRRFVIVRGFARKTWPVRAAIIARLSCSGPCDKSTQDHGNWGVDELRLQDVGDKGIATGKLTRHGGGAMAQNGKGTIDRYGWTELHHKASAGATEDVRALLARSADVNALDEDGRTPLHWAAFRGHAGVVKTLLEGGAAADVIDKNGSSAETLARARGFHAVGETIRNAMGAQARERRL